MSRMRSPQDLEICSVAQAPELETALRQLEQGPWLHRLQHRVVARIPVGWVKMETPLPDDSSWYHPGEGVAPSGAVAEGRRSSCYLAAQTLAGSLLGPQTGRQRKSCLPYLCNTACHSSVLSFQPRQRLGLISPASGWVSAPPAAGSLLHLSSSGPWCA